MSLRFAAVLLVFASLACSSAQAEDAKTWVQANLDDLVSLYRHFHSHPEISFEEKETAARVAAEWKAAGYEVTTGIGGHGVVGLLKNGDGPTLLLRTDLDALPVTEQTELAYASKAKVKNESGVEVGVMHACGHDIHITSLIGTARYLATHKDLWKGTVMLLGQPAEERGAGAKAMLDDGLFRRFKKPDFALALHVDASLASGHVAYRAGFALANTDSIDITVHGKGGHGAMPHTTVDPIVQAAQLVLSLQTLVSREIDPLEPSVVTVGSIHGGTKHNIIGDSCQLQITVRSFSDKVRAHLLEGIRRKAKAVAAGAGAPEPTITVSEGTPAMFNDEKLTARLAPIFRQAIGENKVSLSEQSMGGEDFSRYGRAGVPIHMFRIGTVDAKRLARMKDLGQEPPSLHSPKFYPDAEETLATGVVATVAAALELLKP